MIRVGDCRAILRTLEGRTVQTCVTSPPYYGLRDYGVEGQIGLEETPEQFIAQLVDVFREVRNVLRDDGTLWLNIGDSYAANRSYQVEQTKGGPKHGTAQAVNGRGQKAADYGLKPKDLIGIPWMLAFALRSDGAASPAHMHDVERMIAAIEASYDSRAEWPDRIAAEVERLEREHIDANRGGWYLRQDIIWHKPNPMPESVKDRCTKAHEYLFLLTKSPRYYFDADAIAEQATGLVPGNKAPAVAVPGLAEHNNRSGLHDYAARQRSKRNSFARETKESEGEHGQKPQHREGREDIDYTGTRNKRSVWTVPTAPFKEAHFATFPPALIEPCILAGSKPGDLVLDPFMGAGTTAVVAERLGRRWVGCELSQEYAGIANRRLKGVTGGLAFPTAEASA